jgi:nicotinamide-nucleotide adenylyltransferase
MIRAALKEAGIPDSKVWIVPVQTYTCTCSGSVQSKDTLLTFKLVYTNEALTSDLFNEAGYEVRVSNCLTVKMYMSTVVREKMLQGEDWVSWFHPA